MPRAFLSEELVSRLQSTQREEYWDTSTRGLVLRVAGRSKSWSLIYSSPIQVRQGGKARRLRRSLGRWPGLTVAEARREAKRLLLLVDKGLDPALQPEECRRVEEVGFAELGRFYLEEKAKPNKGSWKQDRWMLEAVVGPMWGNRPVSEISTIDVHHMVQTLSQRGPILANRVLSVVRQTFQVGLLKGLLPTNPAIGVPKPGRERARSRVLTPAEIVAIWNASKAHPERHAAMLRLRMLTAQRGVEIFRMSVHDFEPATGGLWWNLPAPDTKSRRPHRIFLTPSVIEILEELGASPAGWFFPRVKDPSRPADDSTHLWASVREASGTSGWVPKDIRRTAATLMSRNGVPRFVVRRVLNHSDNEVTAVYDLYEYDDEVRRALLILEKAIRDLLERGTQGLSTLVRSLPVGAGTTAEPAVELGFQPPGAVSGHLDRRWKLA